MTRQSTGKPPARHIPDELVRRPKVIGTKRCRSGRPLPSSDDQCSKPEYQEPTSLSRSDSLPNNENDEIACINENQRSQEDIPSCSQLSLAQQMNLEQLLTERFSRWMDGIKYTAPPDDRLPPRKRFKTAQWQPGLLRAEEKDESEDDFVVIPHPDCRTGFFHLACPFYVHSPEKYQKCLIQHDVSSIETLIKHLLQHHDRPLYCRTCRRAFETLINRDSHVLENTCERNDQKPLDGLTESQKAKLIKKDRYYFGESSRWRRIWSTVLPSIEQPQSPYLDRGEGLRVSMIRDFWAADGKKFVFDFVEGLDIYANEKSTTYRITCQKALDGLMNGVIEQDSKSNILSVGR
ncbi:hypothetical protein DER45DRAFT_498831 [Fusarium avenaceum]|nr:hypothetical protein DER45DRAFT_498831 [Fusarium avenaceum]